MALRCKDCPRQYPLGHMVPPPQSPLQALPCMRTLIQPSVQLLSAGFRSQPPCTPHASLGTPSRSQRISSAIPGVPGFPWSNPSTIPRTPNILPAPPSLLPGTLYIPLKSSLALVRCSLLCLLCLLGLKCHSNHTGLVPFSTHARKIATGLSKQQLSIWLMTSNALLHLLIFFTSLAMKLCQSCLKTQCSLVIGRRKLLGSCLLVASLRMACMLCMLGQTLSSM